MQRDKSALPSDTFIKLTLEYYSNSAAAVVVFPDGKRSCRLRSASSRWLSPYWGGWVEVTSIQGHHAQLREVNERDPICESGW